MLREMCGRCSRRSPPAGDSARVLRGLRPDVRGRGGASNPKHKPNPNPKPTPTPTPTPTPNPNQACARPAESAPPEISLVAGPPCRCTEHACKRRLRKTSRPKSTTAPATQPTMRPEWSAALGAAAGLTAAVVVRSGARPSDSGAAICGEGGGVCGGGGDGSDCGPSSP